MELRDSAARNRRLGGCRPAISLAPLQKRVARMDRNCRYRSWHRRAVCVLAIAVSLTGGLVGGALAKPEVSTFKLGNGMDVVVIPDHRVPVVTHMVWYRAGAGDDPWGTKPCA